MLNCISLDNINFQLDTYENKVKFIQAISNKYGFGSDDFIDKLNADYEEVVDNQTNNTSNISEQIYSQLGDKTQSANKLLQKQNIFTVTPIQPIDKAALSVSNKIIDFDESTESYRQQILEQSKNNIDNSKKINIYSTDKNGFNGLSNLLNGKVIFDGKTFATVEHLYQWKKAKFAGDEEVANKILNNSNGFEAQKLGKQVKGLNKTEWDKVSSQELEDAMRLAFEQNQSSKELLLKTGSALLTHKANFSLGKWESEFPRILMKIRSELQDNSNTVNSENYNSDDVVFVSIGGKRGESKITTQEISDLIKSKEIEYLDEEGKPCKNWTK